MTDIDQLKHKLQKGKNESSEGYQKFASAQFYENLTREQFAGAHRPRLTVFNSARDALNPHVNSTTLKNRLWVIDHYKYRYGADHTFWVHSVLRRAGANLNRYKFNYVVKAFLAYQVYSSYKNFRYVDSMSFMSTPQRVSHVLPITLYTGAFVGASLMI